MPYGSPEARKYLLERRLKLSQEREPVMEMFQQLADYVMPRRTPELIRQEGGSKPRTQPQMNDNLIDGTPRWAVRTLAQGMMSGITSPARKWFKLTISEPDLADDAEVKDWLAQVEDRMRDYFARSNVYSSLYRVYEDMAAFGTACLFIDEDDEDVFRCYVWGPGTYYIANSPRLDVDVLYRDVPFTVRQLVRKFGLENCSRDVQNAYTHDRDYEQNVDVLHVVEPREDFSGKTYGERKPWRSCWMEIKTDGSSDSHGFLREHGFDERPMCVPRWATIGTTPWGNGPSLDAMPTCRQIQKIASREMMAIDKLVNPALSGPMALNAKRVSQLPGDYVGVPTNAANLKVEPLFRVEPQAIPAIQALRRDRADEIKRLLYADLFRSWPAVENMGTPPTAQQVRSMESERMLQLGPTMEITEDELLDPFMARALGIAFRGGYLPPMPEVLKQRGGTIRVEFLSILTQAQKLIGVSSIREVSAYVMELAQLDPTVKHTLDTLIAPSLFADAVGAPPSLVRAPEEVRKLIEQDAQRVMEQQRMQQQLVAAQTAKDLGQTPMGTDNAMSRLAAAYDPAQPQGVQ